MKQKKEWILTLTRGMKTIFMEDMISKQSTKVWTGFPEFEKIKGLGGGVVHRGLVFKNLMDSPHL